MKKILLMTAAAAMFFTSCSKDDNGQTGEAASKTLTVKIAATPETRAMSATGTAIETTLVDGHIYVINSAGGVVKSAALNIAQAKGTGQELTGVPGDAKVYIIGNIPAGITPASYTTLTAIQSATAALSTQTEYDKAALANFDGQAKQISVTSDTDAEVKVTLSPLYSRIELSEVKGGENIKSFTVAGVYVDSYYPSFNLAGVGAGTLHEQGMDTDFAGVLGDAATPINSSVGYTSATANAGTGKVWNYHVGAGSLPRFIIKLTNVVYKEQGSNVDISDPAATVRYLTVKSYTGFSGNFERGNIYKVGTITFDMTKTGGVPNPENVDLTATVEVAKWVVKDLTPSLQ